MPIRKTEGVKDEERTQACGYHRKAERSAESGSDDRPRLLVDAEHRRAGHTFGVFVRRSARPPQTGGSRRPPRPQPEYPGDLLPDCGDDGQQLGHGAGRKDGRAPRRGSGFDGSQRPAGAGHEHQAQPAVRTELRVLLGGSVPRRQNGCGVCARHPEERYFRLPQALRVQQPGTAPHGHRHRRRRAHPARDLPHRVRDRRRRGQAAHHHVLVQQAQRHPHQREYAPDEGHPPRRATSWKCPAAVTARTTWWRP